MCGSLLAPKAPQMAPPMAAAPRVSESVQQTQAVEAEQPVAIENPEPQFQAGSEIDEMDQMDATKGTKRLQTHSKTDTGLAIPL